MIWLFLLLVLLIPLTAVVLDSQLGRALARRIEGRSARDGANEARVEALEAEVERLARDIQRLEEESEFLHRLLEQRRSEKALPPGDQRG